MARCERAASSNAMPIYDVGLSETLWSHVPGRHTMLSIFRQLRPISPTELESAVRAIAAECRSQSTPPLGAVTDGMNRSELRGYARARFRRAARRAVLNHFSGKPALPTAIVDTIHARVLDLMSQQAVRERMLAPTYSAGHRAA